MSILFKGNLEEGNYTLIKSTDGWVLKGETSYVGFNFADRKTENCSEKPNNCEELNAYRKCVESRSFWDNKHCDGCYFDERCPFDVPKDEPQTERSE